MEFGFGLGTGFTIFGIMFAISFLLITGIIIAVIVKGIGTWNKNNHSPRLSAAAKIVAKRTNVSHHNHTHAGDMTGYGTSSTTYYVTFQFESGDRMEFIVPGTEYGMLIEGDEGKLNFQGTRYLSFERR